MQLSWKNIFSGYQRGGKSFFPDRLACFSFDLILFSKLLTEALLDPETNQLVLISAVLVWVSTVLTSEHYCIGQNNTHQLTGGSEKTISGADTWTQSLRLGLAGKQQPSVSNKLVVNIYISGIWKMNFKPSCAWWNAVCPGVSLCLSHQPSPITYLWPGKPF